MADFQDAELDSSFTAWQAAGPGRYSESLKPLRSKLVADMFSTNVAYFDNSISLATSPFVTGLTEVPRGTEEDQYIGQQFEVLAIRITVNSDGRDAWRLWVIRDLQANQATLPLTQITSLPAGSPVTFSELEQDAFGSRFQLLHASPVQPGVAQPDDPMSEVTWYGTTNYQCLIDIPPGWGNVRRTTGGGAGVTTVVSGAIYAVLVVTSALVGVSFDVTAAVAYADRGQLMADNFVDE